MTRRVLPLPKNWQRIRRRVLADWACICHVCGQGDATEVDHVLPASRGGTDERTNLRPIHGRYDPRKCHLKKTARESLPPRIPRRREQERHPGDVLL